MTCAAVRHKYDQRTPADAVHSAELVDGSVDGPLLSVVPPNQLFVVWQLEIVASLGPPHTLGSSSLYSRASVRCHPPTMKFLIACEFEANALLLASFDSVGFPLKLVSRKAAEPGSRATRFGVLAVLL